MGISDKDIWETKFMPISCHTGQWSPESHANGDCSNNAKVLLGQNVVRVSSSWVPRLSRSLGEEKF